MADFRALAILGLLALVFAAAYLATHYKPVAPGIAAESLGVYVRDEAGLGLGGAALLLRDGVGNVVFNGTIPYSKSFELNESLKPYTYVLECPAGYAGNGSGELGTEPLVVSCRASASPAQNITPANNTVLVGVYDTNGTKVSGATVEVRAGGALAGTYYTADGSAGASYPGNYTLVVRCPAGYLGNFSATVTGNASLNFTCAPEAPSGITISASPSSGSMEQGSAASTTVSVRAGGAIALSCSGIPLHASCSFSPAEASNASPSTLTIATSASTPAGTYEVLISGLYEDIAITATYNLTVSPKTGFDFSISLGSIGGSVVRGAGTSVQVSASLLSGASQNVALSCSGLPAGASCSFSPAGMTPPASSTMSMLTTNATPAGTYPITVSGAGGGIARSSAYSLSITAGAPADTTPPAAITAIGLGNVTPNSVRLSWTAPGDDGNAGTASQYDIRYSSSPISESSWASATQVPGAPAPAPAGTLQGLAVTGLSPSTTYYFAIKTADEVPNWSGISNVANATTASADTSAPSKISLLASGSPSSPLVTLAWLAPGDDGGTGTAYQYDVRYSTSQITESNWAPATQATGEPSPAPAGTTQTFTVAGLLPSTTYYFAIKTADEVPNWSGISNVANATTPAADMTPPSRITLLAMADPASSLVTLAWLSPGNNGSTGTAYQYDVRYSTSQITESNWAYATQAAGEPAPLPAGTTQTFTVAGLLPSTTYYFAIKTADEVPNWSELSNVVGKTTGTADYGPTPYVIKVLDLSYIPTISGKVDISQTGDWRGESISALTANIDGLRRGLIDTLVNGSIYRGYKNPSATPSLAYDVIEKRVFYEPVPPSPTFRGMDNAPSADHIAILNGLGICNYVENLGVKEVWIWMYHTAQVAPIESNMAGPYGDISNSYRENDLPVCAKTYTVYDYNYGRSYSMAVEDHTHQIEAILRYVDDDLFWNRFVGAGGRCGWTHYPPNGRWDYDWNNANPVMSDCGDWKPDNSGQKASTSCSTWSTSPPACDSDEGLSFKRWWMQNIPGKDNGIQYNGRNLKNWWVFIGKFDIAMGNRSLAD